MAKIKNVILCLRVNTQKTSITVHKHLKLDLGFRMQLALLIRCVGWYGNSGISPTVAEMCAFKNVHSLRLKPFRKERLTKRHTFFIKQQIVSTIEPIQTKSFRNLDHMDPHYGGLQNLAFTVGYAVRKLCRFEIIYLFKWMCFLHVVFSASHHMQHDKQMDRHCRKKWREMVR